MAGESQLPEPELSSAEEAVRRARRAVMVLEGAYGPEHARTAWARLRLVTALRLAGDLAAAEEEAARAYAALASDDLPERGRAATELGLIWLERGNQGGALEMLGATWERELAQRGPSLESGRFEIYYALALGAAGRLGEAIDHQAEAADALAVVLGQDHPEVTTARLGLAVLLGASGRGRDAIGIAGEVVAMCRRTLGEDHIATLTAGVTLAAMLARGGEPAAARRQLTTLHGRLTEVAGPDHPRTLDAAAELAAAQAADGDLGAAARTVIDVGASRARRLGPTHSRTVQALRVAGELARPVDPRFAVTAGVQAAALAIGGLGFDHHETRKALEALRVTQQSGPFGPEVFELELLELPPRSLGVPPFADAEHRASALASIDELVEGTHGLLPAALLPAEDRGPLRRTAHGRLDPARAIKPGDRFAIVVWMDDAQTGPHEIAVTLGVASGVDVVELEAWLVVSRHFAVEGPVIQTLIVERREPRSADLRFDVCAVHDPSAFAEPPEARILFSADGWPSGTLELAVPLQEREEVLR